MSDIELRRTLKNVYGEDSYELGGYINFNFRGKARQFPLYLSDYRMLFEGMLTKLEKAML